MSVFFLLFFSLLVEQNYKSDTIISVYKCCAPNDKYHFKAVLRYETCLWNLMITHYVICSLQNSINYEKCVCRDGFWGESCQQTCPGKSGAPCNNHGVCDTATGVCQCDVNWQGDHACSSCTPGWLGEDCRIVQQNPNYRTAAAFGPGNLITLNGTAYRFIGNGEYYLLKPNDLLFEVQVRMVSCFEASTCFNAVAAKIGNSVVMIHGRFTSSGEPSVFIDGKEVHSLESKVGPSSEGFVLRRLSYLKFVLETNRGLSLNVRLYDRYLDIHMQVENKRFCKSAEGLWGKCNDKVPDKLG